MSLQAATTYAQVLPALLAIGLLVPIFAKIPVEYPERFLFATQTIAVAGSEYVLLYYIARDAAVPHMWSQLVSVAMLWAIVAIGGWAFVWARKSPVEKRAAATEPPLRESWREYRLKVKARRAARRRRRSSPEAKETPDDGDGREAAERWPPTCAFWNPGGRRRARGRVDRCGHRCPLLAIRDDEARR